MKRDESGNAVKVGDAIVEIDGRLELLRDHNTLVEMSLPESTLIDIERLQEMTGRTNKTGLVVSAVELAILVLEAHERGRLCIEKDDGTKEYLTIVGI